MMTKDEKIAAIYREIADKELSFGCVVKLGKYDPDGVILREIRSGDYILYLVSTRDLEHPVEYDPGQFVQTIGHPVMIGDILDWTDRHTHIASRSAVQHETIIKWKKKREPIESQSDECIDFVIFIIGEGI